ncbi:hypothetical protein ACFLXC_07155, partial [Chloroflexota bacterium]
EGDMPKVYPFEVRLFAVEKKRQGHSWDKIAELIREEFKIQSPNRRQMSVWLKDLSLTEGLQRAFSEDTKKKAELVKVQALDQTVHGLLPHLWAARDAGEDIEYSGWRWFFQMVERVIGGRAKFMRFAERYFKEPEVSIETLPQGIQPEASPSATELRGGEEFREV